LIYATAFKALLDWPQGFFDFLDAYRERPMQKESSGLRREFGTLYISWFNRFWKYPHFDFIQAVFNDYLLKTIPHFQIVYSRRSQDYPDLLEKLNYLDLKRTVKYLKSSNLSVYRLVNTGHLKAEYFAGDEAGVWFAREDLDRLKVEWQDHLRFADLYRLLGPSKRLIHELLAVGLLQQVPESPALKRSGLYLYRHSLERLLEALRLQTQIVSPRPLNAVSILDLCIRLGSVKLDFAQVLQRILAGKLPAYHHTTTLLPLTELCFAFEEVQNLADVLKNERDWFNKHETQSYLNINARVLRQLMQANLLNPSVRLGPKLFFQRSQVYALQERWIFSREMAAILDLPVLSLRHLIKQGLFAEFTSSFPDAPNLNCVDRKAFMAWHEKHILLAQMKGLNPNLNTLSKLLQLRGVKPILASSQIYLRKEVMPLMLEGLMNEQDNL
jgi:hypothetical protein